MNKTTMISTVSEKSGINISDCAKVMNVFEDVLTDELSLKNRGSIIDKTIQVLNYIKSSKFTPK